MIRRTKHLRARRAILAGAAAMALQSVSLAGVTLLNNSTATFRFDPDTSGGTDLKIVNLLPPPSSAGMPAPPSYQFSKTFASGSSSSTAKASLGYVTNPTTATFTLAPGTGVTQSDPGNAAYKGDSLLRISFDGWFSATSPSFGPPATGYVSVAVGGIVGAGGSTQFTGQVNFVSADGATTLRPQVNFSKTFSSAGTFAQTFTSSAGLSPLTLAAGTKFRVKGFFEFRASNEVSPSQIAPLDIDVGSAPPTATWYAAGDGRWGAAANWTPPQGSSLEDLGLAPQSAGPQSPEFQPSVPAVPNGAGQRARFTSQTKGAHTVTLASLVKMGAIDVDSNDGTLIFSATGTAGFVMDTGGAGNAAIQARSDSGGYATAFDTPIVLKNNLEIDTDGNYAPGDLRHTFRSSVEFRQPISGRDAVIKNGEGSASFYVANSYSGNTHINGGELFAGHTNSLGGEVLIDDAQLTTYAVHAARKGMPVKAFDNSQIELRVDPASDERFFISKSSAVSGSAAILESLGAEQLNPRFTADQTQRGVNPFKSQLSSHPGDGALLLLAPGAMIGHYTFDISPDHGNPQNLGNQPLYVFGISNDFKTVGSRLITIGSDSNSPWVGFGSDRTERTFGSSASTTTDQIRVKGSAELVSLHETLWLNARLVSGSGDILTKRGKGTVSIENKRNDFRGTIGVTQGSLLVNGGLPGVRKVSVREGASLGGRGTIGGPVEIDGGAINPGGNKTRSRAGTLTVDTLSLTDDALLNFDLNTPGVVGNGVNDLIDVKGDLHLDGTLDITDLGGLSVGRYTLMEVGGDLTGPGLTLGITPTTQFNYRLITTDSSVLLDVSNAKSLASLPVPEPGISPALIAACMLLARRRCSRYSP